MEKIGIIPTGQLNIEERNYISKNIADKLATNVNELANSYNELYMRIFNCNMYYAKIDKKFKPKEFPDYLKIMTEITVQENHGLSHDEAVLSAFKICTA